MQIKVKQKHFRPIGQSAALGPFWHLKETFARIKLLLKFFKICLIFLSLNIKNDHKREKIA